MAILIERAKAADAEAVLHFTKRCGSETDNLSFGEEGIPISVEKEASWLGSIENADTACFLVARDGEEIVGTGSYAAFPKKRMAHRGELGLTVRQSHWNQGIGTMLLERLLAFAKHIAKSEIVSLEVRSDNAAAIHLYQKFGFEKIGTFRGYFKMNGAWIDFDIMELIF